MSDPTKQTKIGEQPDDNLAMVTNLVIDLVNAPAYALFMTYKKFKREQEAMPNPRPTAKPYRTLQCIADILKTILAVHGIDADSEKL